MSRRRKMLVADLLCGAGGSSTGAAMGAGCRAVKTVATS